MAQIRGPPIGIDLGTTYTRVAYYDGSYCRMIPDEQGNAAMPSYVAFTDSGVLIGEAARKQASQNPTNTIFDVVRLIGRKFSDPSVRNDKRLWPFKVIASTDGKLLVDVLLNGKFSQFTPVDICSMILIKIKENAEKNIVAEVKDAVITVPAYFNYEQRQAMKEAGTIANLNVLQIISAPAASALFYGMEILYGIYNKTTSGPKYHNMVIIDLGAGTFDVAAVTIKENICKVRATTGDIHLGGSDLDNNLIDHFINSLKKKERDHISSNPEAISNLKLFFEKAKISLCSDFQSMGKLKIPLYNDVTFSFSITEKLFRALIKDLTSKCINIISMCLGDAKMSIVAVHEVILTGGSTRIPFLQSKISELFMDKELIRNQNSEACTAYGAAFQAFSVCRLMNGIPCCLSLSDVVPFSLGLQYPRGEMMVYVPKNTTIPIAMKSTITSHTRKETKLLFEVYEGEGTIEQNSLLRRFELSITHIAPTEHKIDVTFKVHGDGTLMVTAEESSAGIRKNIILTANDIEDSKRRAWEALMHKEREKSTTETPFPKSLSRSSTSGKWDELKGKGMLSKLLTMDKERSEKIRTHISKQPAEPAEYAVGIDFGTTYSCVAVWQRNSVKIIENEYGSRLTYSAMAFTDTGRLIGDTVNKEQVTTNPASIIPNIKRLIGRFSPNLSSQDDNIFLPFRVRRDDKGRSMVLVQYKEEDKLFAPEEIAAMILSKMKEVAEAHLGSKVSKAVISVPACFDDSQRKAIKDAGVIAGLDVLQLLNETTAAAIGYFLQKVSGQSSGQKTLLFFDLGGGNLHVSIIMITEGIIQVQAVAGDTDLGGEDFNNNMVCSFVQKFMTKTEKDISNNPRSLRRLRAACEKAKRVLSANAQTVLEVDALDEGIDFRSVITRKEFEEFNEDLFKRSINCVERCLEDAMINKQSIDEVVLVGGSTRIPKIQELLKEFFNGKELCKSINADEEVVYGTAVQAAILSGNEDRGKFNISELKDTTSQSLWLENKDGETMNLLIPAHTPIPAKHELIFCPCSDNLSSFSFGLKQGEFASTVVFGVSGITPKPKGNSKINLSFEVDNSGILNLTAKETSGGVENGLMISKENGGLTTEEIQKFTEDAARYKAEDEEHKARATALNSFEKMAYNIKAMVRDRKLSDLDKNNMEKIIADAIEWIEEDTQPGINEINDKKTQLEDIQNQLNSLVGPPAVVPSPNETFTVEPSNEESSSGAT